MPIYEEKPETLLTIPECCFRSNVTYDGIWVESDSYEYENPQISYRIDTIVSLCELFSLVNSNLENTIQLRNNDNHQQKVFFFIYLCIVTIALKIWQSNTEAAPNDFQSIASYSSHIDDPQFDVGFYSGSLLNIINTFQASPSEKTRFIFLMILKYLLANPVFSELSGNHGQLVELDTVLRKKVEDFATSDNKKSMQLTGASALLILAGITVLLVFHQITLPVAVALGAGILLATFAAEAYLHYQSKPHVTFTVFDGSFTSEEQRAFVNFSSR